MDDAEKIRVLNVIIGMLIGVSLLLILYLKGAPIAECDKCAHCATERLAQKKAVACPICRQYHLPGEGKHNKDSK